MFPQKPVYSICPWPQRLGCKPRGYQPEEGMTTLCSCSLFSLPRTGAWLSILDEVFKFEKTIQSNTNNSSIAGTLYISDRNVIHFHVQISARLVYRYWKKLLMEVAHTTAPYFCDVPVAHNHHSPRSVNQMQQL